MELARICIHLHAVGIVMWDYVLWSTCRVPYRPRRIGQRVSYLVRVPDEVVQNDDSEQHGGNENELKSWRS